MEQLTITVDLSALVSRWIGQGEYGEHLDLADTLAKMAAQQLVEKLGRDEVFGDFRDRVRSITDSEIRSAIAPLIRHALDNLTQQTDAFGNSTGPAKPLSVLIVDEAKKQLGNPSRDGWKDRQQAKTLLQQLVDDEVNHRLSSELKAALDEAKAEVRAAVREKGAELIAQTIERMAEAR